MVMFEPFCEEFIWPLSSITIFFFFSFIEIDLDHWGKSKYILVDLHPPQENSDTLRKSPIAPSNIFPEDMRN